MQSWPQPLLKDPQAQAVEPIYGQAAVVGHARGDAEQWIPVAGHRLQPHPPEGQPDRTPCLFQLPDIWKFAAGF
eukprot:8294777-Alexandrium_andersonii.AAC.1